MKTIAITKHEGVVALLVKRGYLSDDPEVQKTQVYESWPDMKPEEWETHHVVVDLLTAVLPFWFAADCGRITEVEIKIPEKEKANAPKITEKRATDWLHRIGSYDVRRL